MKLLENIKVIGLCGTMQMLVNQANGKTDKQKCAVVTFSLDLAPQATLEQTYKTMAQPMTFNAWQLLEPEQIENATLALLQYLPDDVIKSLNDFLK